MKLARTYPDPDPMLRFLPSESIPGGLWTLPKQERAQRVRYVLMSLAAGLHPVVAWPMALSESSDDDIFELLKDVQDSDIEDMLRAAADARRQAAQPEGA